MAVFSRAGLRQASNPALSILRLFNAGEARPEDLTAYDRALPTAINRVPTNRTSRKQRGSISASVIEQLTAERD